MDIFPFLLKLHNFSAIYLLNNRQRATVYLLSFAYSFFPAYCASNIVVANYSARGSAENFQNREFCKDVIICMASAPILCAVHYILRLYAKTVTF